MALPRHDYDPRRLFVFACPTLPFSKNKRTIGVYVAGALVGSPLHSIQGILHLYPDIILFFTVCLGSLDVLGCCYIECTCAAAPWCPLWHPASACHIFGLDNGDMFHAWCAGCQFDQQRAVARWWVFFWRKFEFDCLESEIDFVLGLCPHGGWVGWECGASSQSLVLWSSLDDPII